MNPVKVVITGSKGRMGRTLASCAARMRELVLAGEVDLGDDLAGVIDDGDVVVDFSFHNASAPVAKLCAERGKALVIGTTGHTEEEAALIREQSARIPMVWASNYSTGVNTLFWLVRKAAAVLGPAYDIEVVEMHHRLKKDAPSGTALTLANEAAAGRGLDPKEALQHGRVGLVGERGGGEIGMHSLRGGDVVGDHTVLFAGLGERVELTHRASSRETFANGALRAACWVVGRPPGIYSMQDVLGLV